MQSNRFKIILPFTFFIFATLDHCFGQAFLRDIEVADSLFGQKKFTESFEIYKAIYETGEQVSAAMLLKMAYISEGIGDESQALYYLNTYYLQTTNEKVFDKIQELVSANDLKGYEYADKDWFFNIYYKYYYHLLGALFAVSLGAFLIALYHKIKSGKRTYCRYYASSGVIVATTLLFLLVNFGRQYDHGILVKNNAYIMSAPSAGAAVLDISKAGHRVKISGRKDVWLQIRWNNQIGYVKNTYVKPLFF